MQDVQLPGRRALSQCYVPNWNSDRNQPPRQPPPPRAVLDDFQNGLMPHAGDSMRRNAASRLSPRLRFLSEDEATRVIQGYEHRNRFIAPIVRRGFSWLLGWQYRGDESDRQRLVRQLPLIAFRVCWFTGEMECGRSPLASIARDSTGRVLRSA